MYIVRNSTNTLIANGLADIEYDGHFIELVIDNSKQINKLKKFSGLEYNLTAGIGKLEAKAAGFEQYLTDSDAKFYDTSIAYTSKSKMTKDINYGFSFGYRYNQITTEAKTSGEYSMITEFKSEFHGPFATLSLTY